MYRAILVAFFLLQTVLSYLIPVIGPAASFIHLSWLYSLYCFEYKWSLAGWSLERRLAHLEQNWAYFAGFGSPFTLATFFVPNFVSKGIFALLFPVVSASLLEFVWAAGADWFHDVTCGCCTSSVFTASDRVRPCVRG